MCVLVISTRSSQTLISTSSFQFFTFIAFKSSHTSTSHLILGHPVRRLPFAFILIFLYGIDLWGCSKPCNTKILQTFQSKMLRMISTAPWYVSNQTLHSDLEIQYVTEVVTINANKYKNRSTEHSNQLIRALFNPLADRRLKRLWPEDLAQ